MPRPYGLRGRPTRPQGLNTWAAHDVSPSAGVGATHASPARRDYRSGVSFRAAQRAKSVRGGELRLRFERRDWATETESGLPLEGRGYALLDGDRSIGWSDPRLAAHGVEVVRVAGTSYRAEELQDPAFVPGSALVLRPEPENPHDASAVGVWDAAARLQVGYLPRDRAREIAPRLADEPLEALALWQWREPDGRRAGLRILLAPEAMLSERPRPLHL